MGEGIAIKKRFSQRQSGDSATYAHTNCITASLPEGMAVDSLSLLVFGHFNFLLSEMVYELMPALRTMGLPHDITGSTSMALVLWSSPLLANHFLLTMSKKVALVKMAHPKCLPISKQHLEILPAIISHSF